MLLYTIMYSVIYYHTLICQDNVCLARNLVWCKNIPNQDFLDKPKVYNIATITYSKCKTILHYDTYILNMDEYNYTIFV